MNYHRILIDVSIKDISLLDRLEVLSKKKAGNWILYKVEVTPENIEKVIIDLQENMTSEQFYFHFYRNDELIVAFKEKIFRTSTDNTTWKEMIEYGLALGIPQKQLDFYPFTIEDEDF